MKRFEIGMKVWIGNQRGPRWHFDGNCYAFIQGSYNDLCLADSDDGNNEYKVYFLTSEHGDIRGAAAWYPVETITFVSDDPEEYVTKVRKYNKKFLTTDS